MTHSTAVMSRPVPVTRSHWIARPRLLRRLVDQPAPRTVIATAPAGYGKTTLFVQWEGHRAEARPFVWATLQPGDTPGAVLARMSRALAQVVSSPATGVPIVLVVDDLTTGSGRIPILEALRKELPSSATLALATRAEPDLSPGWTTGPVVRFGPEELRFTEMETAQVLRAITGQEPPADRTQELAAWSQGWPAAVCVAASSRPGGQRGADAAVTEARAHHVRDFVVSEVVGELDEDVREFMTLTCVLDHLSPELCGEVTGRNDAGAMLERLVRCHLLVELDDGTAPWGHVHGLVREALRHQLETRQAEILPVLHRRAARWHAQAGLVDEALHHATASGDPRLLSQLLTQHWSHYVHAGRYEDARPWLRACGEEVTRDPGLAIAGAWLAGLAEEKEVVERLLPVATTGRLDQPIDGFAALRSAIALVHLFMTDRPLSSVAPEIELAAATEARHETPWQATAELGLGWVRYLRGQPGAGDAARRAAASATEHQVMVRGLALALAALVAVDNGEDDAGALAEQSMVTLAHAGLEEVNRAWSPFLAQGMVLAHEGRLEAAAEVCAHAVELARAISHMSPWASLVALEHLARVQMQLGRVTAAADAIEEARALADRYDRDDSVFTTRLARLASEVENAPEEFGDALSSRELQVLRLLQGPLRRSEIARELDVTTNTLKTHVRSIYRKLGVTTRYEAVARGRHRGVL